MPSGSLKNAGGVGKELTQLPSNDTIDGLERGVAEDVVGWYGSDDLEVLFNSDCQFLLLIAYLRIRSTSPLA